MIFPKIWGQVQTIDVSPAKVRRQKERMRNHAKWQALVHLEQNKGCRHEVRGPSLWGLTGVNKRH